MSSESDSGDCEIIPSAAVCEQLCKDFSSITATNSALAMYYLQDRDWSLERSLADYFNDNPPSRALPTFDGNDKFAGLRRNLKLITWNLDGLDSGELLKRVVTVATLVKKESPDVVFLQEVVPDVERIIDKQLSSLYRSIYSGRGQTWNSYAPPPTAAGSYYCGMLVLRSATYDSDKRTVDDFPFPGSVMNRHMLKVRMNIYGVPMTLITSHLESTMDFSAERTHQMQRCFEEVDTAPPGDHVLFGGDLNLRDKELGVLPDNTFDLWEYTGSRPEAKYTWDASRNNNIKMNARARCRFDRAYMRNNRLANEQTPRADKSILKPVYFELIGLEKIYRSQKYPSDHWGIMAHFKFI